MESCPTALEKTPKVNVELYQEDQRFCTEKEAEKAGFEKSHNCK